MATEDINLDDPNERFSDKDDSDADGARDPEVDDAVDELKQCLEAEGDQRDLEDDDLSFDAGNQWPDEIKLSRGKQVIDNIEIPPRPMLTIPKLDQPVQLVINQQRRAHLGINVHAESEDADRETADILEGIIRHIQQKSNAELARNWAFERSTKAGRGYYRILSRYCDHDGTGSHWSDQELVIKRILNQSCVYLDPYATEPDWSDGTWGQQGGWIPFKTYKRQWPHSRLSETVLTGDDFDLDQANVEPTWMSNDINGKGLRGVRVMERFVVKEKTRLRIAYVDAKNSDQLHDEYVDEIDPKKRHQYITSLGDRIRARRETTKREVHWMKLNGLEVLEREVWPGKWIPIIPVIGREQFFKNLRRWVGMIRPAKDGARLFNYAATAAVEKEALDTKAPYIGYEGQFKGHEVAWSQSATKNFPYLQVAPVTLGGKPAPLPQRNTASPNLTGSLALLEAADNFIKSATFTYDPSLGASDRDDSGRKVLALQQQGDQGNSHFLDNLATVSMPHEARVLLDLIPHFYDRPGRVQQIFGTDGIDDPKEVILNAPFVTGPNGRPMPVDPRMVEQGLAPKGVKKYDLKKGAYTAVPNVGKNYESRLREGSDEMGRVLEAAPELLKIIGDIYFKFRDFPGHQEIADRLKKMLPPELADGPDTENDPQALKAKLASQQQAMQQLKAAFGDAMKQLETKRTEAMAKVQSEEVKANAQLQLQQMRIDGERQLAKIQANLDLQIRQIEIAMEMRAKGIDINAKREEREDNQRHEIAMTQVEHAMDQDVAAAAHEQALESLGAEQTHESRERTAGHEFEAARTATEQDREDQRAEAQRAYARDGESSDGE